MEVVCTRKGTEGSNPSLSEMFLHCVWIKGILNSYWEDIMAEHVLHKKESKKAPQKTLKEKREEKKNKKKSSNSSISNS